MLRRDVYFTPWLSPFRPARSELTYLPYSPYMLVLAIKKKKKIYVLMMCLILDLKGYVANNPLPFSTRNLGLKWFENMPRCCVGFKFFISPKQQPIKTKSKTKTIHSPCSDTKLPLRIIQRFGREISFLIVAFSIPTGTNFNSHN